MAKKIWDIDEDLDSIFHLGNMLDTISTYFPFIVMGILVIAGILTLGA
jgi:hypothetical protein